jgi:hypothetical protein
MILCKTGFRNSFDRPLVRRYRPAIENLRVRRAAGLFKQVKDDAEQHIFADRLAVWPIPLTPIISGFERIGHTLRFPR